MNILNSKLILAINKLSLVYIPGASAIYKYTIFALLNRLPNHKNNQCQTVISKYKLNNLTILES